MRRRGKMLHVSQIGDFGKGMRPKTPDQQLAMALAVRKSLGPTISKHVEKLTLDHGVLILHVKDPIWRRQLQADLTHIRACLSQALSGIDKVILKS